MSVGVAVGVSVGVALHVVVHVVVDVVVVVGGDNAAVFMNICYKMLSSVVP